MNLSLGALNCPIVFNMDAWAKLPDQYKALLEEMKAGASEAQKQGYVRKDKQNLKKWAANPKLTAVKFDEAEMAEFRRVGGQPLWKKWVNENAGELPAQELLDLVLKTAKEASM